jgi:predicted amidohydrolase
MSASVRIAVLQSRIEPDIAANGAHIRQLLDEAAAQGATLALLPEGALSGYVKAQIKDWAQVDWPLLEQVLVETRTHAERLGIVAVVGSAHKEGDRRPFNSLHVLSHLQRYDKRRLSNTEINDWYSPGRDPVAFGHAGYRFGTTICIEIEFPELFAEYEQAAVDCVLHASYGFGSVGDVKLRGHAAINCLWLAAATPANADEPASGIIGPDGQWMARKGDIYRQGP